MNHGDLTDLVDYHYWARDRMLAAVARLSPDQYTQPIESSFRSVRDTVVHVYAAEWIWYSRWHGDSPTSLIPGDRFPDVDSVREAWVALEQDLRGYVASLDEAAISTRVEYKLLNGKAGSSPFRHMLQHVVNHATYHRGQVTTLLRQLGAAPPEPTDLIAFYRLRG
jgi:uncharacterized damage-inducible protein DinB